MSNTADDYQMFVETTCVYDDAAEWEYLHLGLAGELGEFLGALAKHTRDNFREPVDKELVKKELGDIQWFIAALSSYYGFSLSSVMQGNVDKLTSRMNRGVIRGSGDDR